MVGETPPTYKAYSGQNVAQNLAGGVLLLYDSAKTLEFADAEIDTDGILVLNLRTAKVSNRALNHPTRRVNSER